MFGKKNLLNKYEEENDAFCVDKLKCFYHKSIFFWAVNEYNLLDGLS